MQIDETRVKQAFAAYTANYDKNDEKIALKVRHTAWVADNCRTIAESLEMSEEDIRLAWLIGMLHDVGRFEQLRRYGTFSDKDSIDHANFGADLLFGQEHLIDRFVEDDTYSDLIEAAIRNHSLYRIPGDLSPRVRTFCHILRDADKLDIFRVATETPFEEIYNTTRDDVMNSAVSPQVLEAIMEEHAVLHSLKKTTIDHLVGHISLLFELVYPASVEIAVSQGYLEQILCFRSNNPSTRAAFEEIKKSVGDYLTFREEQSRNPMTGLRFYNAFFTAADMHLRQRRRIGTTFGGYGAMAATEEKTPESAHGLMGGFNPKKAAADGSLECMIALDIEHFKVFNEWYSKAEGDRYLRSIGQTLRNVDQATGSISGYLGDDTFAILMPYDRRQIHEIYQTLVRQVEYLTEARGFLPMLGVYVIAPDDRTTSRQMLDRATIAMNQVAGDYVNRIKLFENAVVSRLTDELELLNEIQQAMNNDEFTFYLQPKMNMQTGQMVSAEALVRWEHPTRGLISPGAFVPLLEGNGFITMLDRIIWEKVCLFQRDLINRGENPIPISVNVSRLDVVSLDVADYFRNLIDLYQLPPELIDIEITEGAYVQSFDDIKRTVSKLRAVGFRVLMDDFGSAYSSLNMLKDITVDVLKVDMKFLDFSEENLNKGVDVLESVIHLAGQMKMPIVVEGVETEAQAKYLQDAGCVYAQGYYYYRPMNSENYEGLLNRCGAKDGGGEREVPGTDRMMGILREEVMSRPEIRKALGPMAYYRVRSEVNELVYRLRPQCMVGVLATEGYPLLFVNQEALDLLGYDSEEEFREACKQGFEKVLADEEVEWVSSFDTDSLQDGTYIERNLVVKTKDGSRICTHHSAKVMAGADGLPVLVSVFTDVSDLV